MTCSFEYVKMEKEINLLLKFGSSLQHNRKLVSYGTLCTWILVAHKWVKFIKNIGWPLLHPDYLERNKTKVDYTTG